jgi:phenylalanyl-tRNA synthetase beta chain
MKISLNWLTDYVDVSMPVTELAELFVRIGFPVESIEQTDTDIVIDLEITSNRPDMLGHIGVARELAAATGAKFTGPKFALPAPHGKAADMTSVTVEAPDLCPRYTARVIKGVKVGPSPRWMVERLEALGLRSINNVVDVTNYVLMEYSQPLHSFDFDKLAGRKIVVRRAKGGEMMVSIDQTRCRLDEQMLVIADEAKAVAIAGIMGGLDTEVSEGTVNVLIEAAQFDPLATRRTSRRLGIMSDSNYRFERGIDPVAIDEASGRACAMIIELAGGELAEGMVDVWAKPFEPVRVSMRNERLKAVLGIDIPESRSMQILEGLGLQPQSAGGVVSCTIPPYRADLYREIDLVEEVARLEGYDKIPTANRVSHAVQPPIAVQQLRRRAAAVMSAAGFDEALTIGFVDVSEAALFGVSEPVCVDPLVRRTNNALRPNLLINLLEVCKTNQNAGNGPVGLYELASAFPPVQGRQLPAEHTQLAVVRAGGELRDIRGVIESLACELAPKSRLEVVPASAKGFDESSSAQVLLDGKAIGFIGAASGDVLAHYGLEHAVMMGALNFDALSAGGLVTRRFSPVPRFPAVRRDISVIVDEAVTWKQLAAAIESVAQPMRVGLDYVTTYRGKPIAAGKKSVTAAITYRSSEGTLRGEQVDAEMSNIVSALKASLGAELRA